MTAPPAEPRSMEPMRASDFPGAGFVPGEPIDLERMNAWAENYGWTCRFVPDGWGARIVYPTHV